MSNVFSFKLVLRPRESFGKSGKWLFLFFSFQRFTGKTKHSVTSRSRFVEIREHEWGVALSRVRFSRDQLKDAVCAQDGATRAFVVSVCLTDDMAKSRCAVFTFPRLGVKFEHSLGNLKRRTFSRSAYLWYVVWQRKSQRFDFRDVDVFHNSRRSTSEKTLEKTTKNKNKDNSFIKFYWRSSVARVQLLYN